MLDKFNQRECINWLSCLSPDVVIVYGMSQLLSSEFLAIPSHGCINLHPSILPNYRGPNPWFWAYYNQDKLFGVTLHYLIAGEDNGPIIDQRTFNVSSGTKLLMLKEFAIGKLGVEMILNTLMSLRSGLVVHSYPQSSTSPTPRARNLYSYEHRNIINWSEWPIERIWHVMRGTETWLNCIDPSFPFS